MRLQGQVERCYRVCQKFLSIADFEILLNSPFSKGDFQWNFAKFSPFGKGGLGGI
jgi:hypothetical protein